MNFNLVEMYNGLLRFNKHILNELAEGLKHLPNKVGTNKKADYNWIRGNNGQDTDKAVRVLLLGSGANGGSRAGSGGFDSSWVQSASGATVGFFTTVKLD
jgi:hypothetical protein